MDLETFQRLPTTQVAWLVRQAGPQVCVFPINGTRRWFILEHPQEAADGLAETYLRMTWERQRELYALFFDHGVDTLLTPIFGPDLLARDEAYLRLLEPGLLWFTRDSGLRDFYRTYDVHVRVYGDARRYLEQTTLAHVLDDFARIEQETAKHRSHRLFFGVCAHDAAETVAGIGVQFHQAHGRLPTKQEIVETYYGERVDPVSFFIGFDRFTVFDMPLIATGDEDLYFTVSPSPYVDQITLRAILYDHLYARRVVETDYADWSAENWQTLSEFYRMNRHHVLGVGRRHPGAEFWYPLPQVDLPSSMTHQERNE